MTEDHAPGHDPWCAEHDPNGTCLGDVRRLPGAGATWIEGGRSPTVVVSLGRSATGRRLPGLDPSEARAVAAVLAELADEIERGRQRGEPSP
ncbi:hypothetical protein CLV30_109162 [Haloactinopolyspora alba]|uniref:Uncharacterized protein n=1 Tax=Haloactinopolyspora alba TaxID=648780 RepID=A0A2P8E066_9ACTN|nr:hypothetical protein [Haloactinopolyspora alba]PSL02854.1 hypothetical protein CLV30_109162 [Haloactinopolyspora alba]